MSESAGELQREMALAQEAGPVERQPERGLSAERIKRELHAQRDDRYRGLISRFREALWKGLIEQEYYDTQLGRLKEICLDECGPDGLERVFGPERPTVAELQTLIESIQAKGYTVVEIGRKEDYTIRDGKITGSIAVSLNVDNVPKALWFPMVDGVIYEEVMKYDGLDIDIAQSLGADSNYLQDAQVTPWRLFRYGDRLYGVPTGQNYLLVNGEIRTWFGPFNDILIDAVISGHFNADGRFSGKIIGIDYNQSPPLKKQQFLVIDDEVQHLISGKEYADLSRPIIHEDGTISVIGSAENGGNFLIFRNRISEKIADKRIEEIHWLSPDPQSRSITGIFNLEGSTVLVVDGEIREVIDPDARTHIGIKFLDYQLQNGKLSYVRRDENGGFSDVAGKVLATDTLIVDGQQFPLPDSALPDSATSGRVEEEVQIIELSISESGQPNFVMLEHRYLPERADAAQIIINGHVVDPPIGEEIDYVADFHVYNGEVNGRFIYRDRNGSRHQAFVVFDQVMRREELPSQW